MKDLLAAGGVATVTDTEALRRFTAPDCPAMILQRAIPGDVQSWLDGLSVDQLPRGRVVLLENAVTEAVAHLCDMAETPDRPERRWLEADIRALATKVLSLTKAKYLRLRLDVIETNACRKFHIDAVRARLVCTYRGTGTQYGFGEDPQAVFTVPTGAPILLRGTLWPPSPDPELRHRSPPIEGTGESRLVLVLDPVFDISDTE